MKRTTFALLAALALTAAPGAAEICTIDDVPAATLLLPYFEVSLDGPVGWGKHTLFSINNASASAAVAHVTLWTDESIPTLDFDVYLTGYDVQTINLYDIFHFGNLPRTADAGADTGGTISPKGPLSQDINFPGSSGPCVAAYTNPVLDATRLSNLQAAHTGHNAPAYGGCLGANYGDNIARGYVTVDSVTQCNLLFPSSATYFSGGIADTRNILWGDYFYVNEAQNFAQGDPLVHIEASPTPGTITPHTFYGRYDAAAGTDQREALPTTMAARYVNGGVFDGGTTHIIWREGGDQASAQSYSCTQQGPPQWYPLTLSQVGVFDETEQVVTGENCPSGFDCGITTSIPNEAQRVKIGEDVVTPFDFGWVYYNLQRPTQLLPAYQDPYAQMWLSTEMDANGRFSVGFSGVAFDNANTPITTLIPFP
jgi:hypothetical protein